jgi:hypothetical protein
MASEGTSTVPRMGSFKRSLFGYRRSEVEATIASRDSRIGALECELMEAAELEAEVSTLSGMVIEREREIRGLNEELLEANRRQDRSIASLEAISRRLQEIEAQARGQATRIRMKALGEAIELGRRARADEAPELSRKYDGSTSGTSAMNGAASHNGNGAASHNGNGAEIDAQSLFEGLIKLEIGPLDDFSQLVGFEDAIGEIGASEISVERFSEGRATLSMHLDEPIELLRELEERSPLEFRVRRTADDNVILDVDDDQGPEQRAA